MAPRRRLRGLRCLGRGALLAAGLWLAGAAAGQETIVGAEFHGPTEAYAHCVLGDCVEYAVLEIVSEDTAGQRYSRSFALSPDAQVFEDIAPRLWDVTGDGANEVVVVQTSVTRGASLAIYGLSGIIAQTAYIGQRNRWLAPVGARDMDGDGWIEVGFVDRPHLAKTLRIFEFRDGALVHEADIPGVSNHQIGQAYITSAMRDCEGRSEFVTLNADWTRVVATGWDGTAYVSRDLGPVGGGAKGPLRGFLDVALAC